MKNYYYIQVFRTRNLQEAEKKIGLNLEHCLCNKTISEDYFTSPTLVSNMKNAIKLNDKEISDLKSKLHKRNVQITDLRGKVSAFTDFVIDLIDEIRQFDEERAEELAQEFQKK